MLANITHVIMSLKQQTYCKTFSLHFNFTILQYGNFAAFQFGVFPVSTTRALMGIVNFASIYFAILSYSQNLQKFDAHVRYVFYSVAV